MKTKNINVMSFTVLLTVSILLTACSGDDAGGSECGQWVLLLNDNGAGITTEKTWENAPFTLSNDFSSIYNFSPNEIHWTSTEYNTERAVYIQFPGSSQATVFYIGKELSSTDNGTLRPFLAF